MTDKAKKYLNDVVHAIGLIEDFAEGITDFDQYQKDLKNQKCC